MGPVNGEQPFIVALSRIAAQMQGERFYGDGAHVLETTFLADLFVRLGLIPGLAGRIIEGSEIAGGETDLVHDGVVAELKVERNQAAPKASCSAPSSTRMRGRWATSAISVPCAAPIHEPRATPNPNSMSKFPAYAG
jgi:hypothetical protein